jgi:hypothetical protein
MTQQELVKQLGMLQRCLAPVISDHFKSVLSEAAKRLTTDNQIKPKIKPKRLTKKDLFNKYYHK